MKRNIVQIDNFVPQKDQKIVLDTNILINLFYPINFSNRDVCDELYARILKNGSKLLITSIQLSEFINLCIRFEYNQYRAGIGDSSLDYKKNYRSTEDYNEKMNAILSIVRSDIVKNFQFVDDGFSRMQPDEIFIYGFSYDFNDALLAAFVKEQDAILVTNDYDFINYGSELRIVTNNKLLGSMH